MARSLPAIHRGETVNPDQMYTVAAAIYIVTDACQNPRPGAGRSTTRQTS